MGLAAAIQKWLGLGFPAAEVAGVLETGAGQRLPMTPLTSESFDEFVRTHALVVVHFWAEWNGYDAEMKRFLETGLPDELGRSAAIAKVDMDASGNAELCVRHRIIQLPFVAFYRDAVLFESVTGLGRARMLSVLETMCRGRCE